MGIFLPGGGQLLDVSANFLSGFRDPRLIQRSHQSVSIQIRSSARPSKRLRKPTSQQRHEVESVHDRSTMDGLKSGYGLRVVKPVSQMQRRFAVPSAKRRDSVDCCARHRRQDRMNRECRFGFRLRGSRPQARFYAPNSRCQSRRTRSFRLSGHVDVDCLACPASESPSFSRGC